MKLLVDANLSPRVTEGLRGAGYDAVHVADLGLLTARDEEIFDRASAAGLTVITADSDFSALLALRRSRSPSVVHLRHVAERPPDVHTALLLANLPTIAEDLQRGAVASGHAEGWLQGHPMGRSRTANLVGLSRLLLPEPGGPQQRGRPRVAPTPVRTAVDGRTSPSDAHPAHVDRIETPAVPGAPYSWA